MLTVGTRVCVYDVLCKMAWLSGRACVLSLGGRCVLGLNENECVCACVVVCVC